MATSVIYLKTLKICIMFYSEIFLGFLSQESNQKCAWRFASVIYKEGSRTGKQTKENNVSINASKETCVANGFSETIGSEGVTLH